MDLTWTVPMEFTRILKEVVWSLVTEGRLSYRRIRRDFGLDDEGLADLRFELIDVMRVAADQGGQFLIWAPVAASALAVDVPASQLETVVAPSAPLAPSSPGAEAALPSAERRQLTVLFCDLVGSTELSTRLDPEDLGDLIRQYQDVASRVIHGFDGFIAKYMGDGILVYFGYPHARERDAERAIHTALAIVEAISALNVTVGRAREVELAVRIGLATGLVVVGETIGEGVASEKTVVGETPNLAARLQGLAAPNGIVISSVTRDLGGDAFAYESLGAHALKGIATPVQVFAVTGLCQRDDDRTTPPQDAAPPLVGRDEEIGLLRRRWEQIKDGLGQVVLLSGEPGIGKSALVDLLRAQVQAEGHLRLAFWCSQYHQNSALYPIITHLERMLRLERADEPEVRLAKLEAGLRPYSLSQTEAVPLLAELLSIPLPAGRYPPLGLTPQQQRQQTHDVLVAWLLEEAERQPVLAVWEDLHWADPSTLELLGMLVDQAPTAAMLQLLTHRPGFSPPWPVRSHMTPITLNRLERPQVAALVTRLAHQKELPPEVVAYIVARTDGVPLFVEELTRTLLESTLLREEAERYTLTGPLTGVAIPATLQDSLMARLDRLPTVREIAQVASVLGRELGYEMLEALAAVDASALQDGLAQLVDAELLYQRGRPPRARYIFKHALVQDAAYQSLLRRTRQQYHQRVAQLLETRFPETAQTEPELVAHHYTEAGEAASAVPYWGRAGQRAAQHSAYAEAIAHLTRGLHVLRVLPATPERDRQELALQTALGPAVVAARGYADPDTKLAYDRVRVLSQPPGDLALHFVALRGLQVHHLVRAELQVAREFGEQLWQLAGAQEDGALIVGAGQAMGQSLFCLGEIVAAHRYLERASSLYDPHQHRFPRWPGGHPGEQCLLLAAWTSWLLGHPDRALQHAQVALALVREHADPFSRASALIFAAMLHQFRREPEDARALAEEAIALCIEQRMPFYQELGWVLHGWALAVLGRGADVTRQMRQGIDAHLASGAKVFVPYALALLADAHREAGQIEQALGAVDEALLLVDQTDCRFYETELLRLRGELLLQAGGPVRRPGPLTAVPRPADAAVETDVAVEAEACFERALTIARARQMRSLELRTAMSLGRLWQRQGRPEAARQMVGEAYGWFGEGRDTVDLQEARSLLETPVTI